MSDFTVQTFKYSDQNFKVDLITTQTPKEFRNLISTLSAFLYFILWKDLQ